MANLLMEKNMQLKLAAAFITLLLALYIQGSAGGLLKIVSAWLWTNIILEGYFNQISEAKENREKYLFALLFGGIFFVYLGYAFMVDMRGSADIFFGLAMGCFTEAFHIYRLKQ